MDKKTKLKTITLFSAIVSLVSFGYKFGMGIYTASLVLVIASLSTLMVFICKIAFVHAASKTIDKQMRNYFIMAVATTAYATIFLLFVVLKVSGIDISNNKTYEGWIGALLILFMLIMFVFSIINLKGALAKTDILFLGLKEITFVSALADVVIIENFAIRIYLQYRPMTYTLRMLDNYLPLAIAILMIIVSVKMMMRCIKYKTAK